MLAYTIKSAIYLSLMYIPYMLMLRKESFFHFNRILLVSIMLLSLILPFFDFHSLSFWNNPIQIGLIFISSQTAIMEEGEGIINEGINWIEIASYTYFIGMTVTLIWKVLQLISIYGTIHSCVLWKEEKAGITIYCHAQDIAPFSWMNSIVISEDDYNNAAEEIINHEMGHVLHNHSFDILIANLIQVLQWWNPLSWRLSSSLRDVHEYEADAEAITGGVDIRQYQTVLVRKVVAGTPYAFANSFNHSSLKKRITMMNKKRSNPWKRTKALYLVPVIAIGLCAFATTVLNKRMYTITEINLIEKIYFLESMRIH